MIIKDLGDGSSHIKFSINTEDNCGLEAIFSFDPKDTRIIEMLETHRNKILQMTFKNRMDYHNSEIVKNFSKEFWRE